MFVVSFYSKKVQMRHSEISIVGDVPTGRNIHLLTFRVTFPQQFPLPKLIQILFGDRVLCLVSGGKFFEVKNCFVNFITSFSFKPSDNQCNRIRANHKLNLLGKNDRSPDINIPFHKTVQWSSLGCGLQRSTTTVNDHITIIFWIVKRSLWKCENSTRNSIVDIWW